MSESGSLRVLVVDDDEAFRSLAGEFLERSGVRVVTESDATRGFERVTEEAFDCVVSDYEMPGVDGLEFLERVREYDEALPFVVLTGEGSEGVASRALSLGATEYVRKRPGEREFDVLVNTVVNAAEAYRTERELAASRAFVADALECVQDAFFVADLDGVVTQSNSRFTALMGVDGDAADACTAADVVPDADRERAVEAFETAVEDGSARFEVGVETGEGRVPYEFTFSRITDDAGAVTHVAGIGRDVSERVERERAVRTLHETTRTLVAADDRSEVFEVALDAAADLLGLPAAGLYRWSEDERALVPAAVTADCEAVFDDVPCFAPGEGIAWDVFASGETRLVADVPNHPDVYNPDTVIESELFVPVGTHGVLLSGARSRDAFDDVDVAAVETLAANTAAALDRHAREAELRATERELTAKTERLAEANRTNALVRRIQSTLVRAGSRNEVERGVCESLVADGPYEFAWVGERTDDGEGVRPRTWTGAEPSLLDACEAADAPTPAERALDTDEVVVVSDLVEGSADCRRRALAAGARSVAAFPLSFDGASFGVLVVYGDRTDRFAGEERAILAEFADTVANALNAIERKNALASGGDVEVTFRASDLTDPVSVLARRLDATFEVDEVVAQDEGSWLVYATTPGRVDADAVLDAASELVAVTSAEAFDTDTADDAFGFVVTSFPCVDALATHGGSVRSFRADPSGAAVTVTLPRRRSVREYVSVCEDQLPSLQLVRRTHAAGAGPGVVADLTEKQRAAVRTAYDHGYFAWPREHTGEEVADAMGVSAPTFHQHLRKGLGYVLASLFDE